MTQPIAIELDQALLQSAFRSGVEDTLRFLEHGKWPDEPISELFHHYELNGISPEDSIPPLSEKSRKRITLCTGLEHAINTVYPGIHKALGLPELVNAEKPLNVDIQHFYEDETEFWRGARIVRLEIWEWVSLHRCGEIQQTES